MSSEKLTRVTMLFKKQPDITDEKFHEYWLETHAPMCIDWMKKYGILKYNQNHISKQGLTDIHSALGWPTASYDGIADFYVRELKHFTDAVADDYYKTVLIPDGAIFADYSDFSLTVGEEYVCLDDLKPVVV
ncbi:hypothetical protein ABW20_dc0108495 [Dactylellina cionopaga]|nr:hypothetical protein ABW20_dc0108495 [Dactylellina cionopaga]